MNNFIKISGTAKEFPLKGILQRNGDYYYLSVDSRIFVPFLSLIDKDNVVHPKEVTDDDKDVGAHITVIKAEEGENLEVEEIGDTFEFFIDGFKAVNPEGWKGVEQVYFISVNSKELESLRKKYDLPAKVDGHDFHITVGVEKEANNWYQKIKTASNSFIDQIQLGSCTENTLVIYINGKRFSYSNIPGQQIYYEIKRWKNWKNKMEAGKKVSILLRNIDKNLQKTENTDLNKNKENSLSLF